MTSVYFNTSPYVEIISGISTIFSFSDGVVKLTGPRGAGKTALLHVLGDELRGEGLEVVIFDTLPKTAEELQDYLVRKLELPADVSFRKALLRHLHIRPRDRQRLILVVDDAEKISVETLLGIASLRKLENNDQCFVNVLLCGEASLDRLLTNPELASLSTDISMQYQLQPLDMTELGKFCASYLNYIGKAHYQLSREHLEMLMRDTHGMPGQVLEQLGEHLTDPTFLLSLNKPETISYKLAREQAESEPEASSLDNIRTLLAEGYRDGLKLLTGAAVTLTIASVLYGTSQYWSRFLLGNEADVAVQSATVPTPAQPVPPGTDIEPQTAPEPETPTVIATTVETNTPTPPTTATTEPAPSPAATVVVEQPVMEQPAREEPAAPQTLPVAPPAMNNAAASVTALRASIDAWATAWQRKDIDAYFAAYHSDFTPQYQNSVSSWRNDRVRNLTRPASISIDITDFEIVGTDAGNSTVHFWQEYHSPTYADRTRKELVMTEDADGQWHILRELNREVIKLPAGRMTAPQSYSQNSPVQSSNSAYEEPRRPAPPAPAPATGQAADDSASLYQFISSWLDAWQDKDVDAYFNHYVPNYQPDSTSSEEWRSDRALKINRPTYIQLQLKDMEVVEQQGSETLLELTLEYRSNFYADRTVKLVRVQRLEDGNLRIMMERNTLVETLPLAQAFRPVPQYGRGIGRAIIEQTF